MSEEGSKETRTLACALTAAEVQHRADELARKVAEHQLIEQAKKDSAKGYGLQLMDVETTIRHLATQVRNKAEDRPIECTWQREYDANVLDLVRNDTGEVVSSRALSASERQGKLFAVGKNETAG